MTDAPEQPQQPQQQQQQQPGTTQKLKIRISAKGKGSSDSQAASNGKRAGGSGHIPASSAAGGGGGAQEASKYRPFRLVEEHVTRNLQRLLSSAAADADASSNARASASTSTDTAAAAAGTSASSTMMAGALTLALAHINKQVLAYAESNGGVAGTGSAEAAESRYGSGGSDDSALRTLQSRILVVSVSSDVASQYIPIMNCVFAAQRKVAPPLTPLTPFFSFISLSLRFIFIFFISVFFPSPFLLLYIVRDSEKKISLFSLSVVAAIGQPSFSLVFFSSL